MTTLTPDQASRLLQCIEYGFADDERAEFTALLSAPDKLTAEEMVSFAERLEAAGEHDTAWHVRYSAKHWRAPAYHNPATPEDATQT